jgi:DNA-binding NarL/FixJ family response regulator
MKVLLVDDDPLIRQSLKIMLSREEDITVIGTASDGAEALIMCEAEQPDVVLMDIRMPNVDGIAATRSIKRAYPDVRIMMLTTFDDKPNISQALSAGADGYLLKTDKISEIAGKLRPLVDGVGVLDMDVLKTLTAPEENPALENLTPREQEITELVAKGFTNKKIAEQLFLSEGTVRNNIVVIMEKLGVKNRTQLGLTFYGK